MDKRRTRTGLIFQTLKETRGPDLFLQYTPANEDMNFASLVLVYVDPVDRDTVRRQIEVEAREWFKRFPVPTIACAADHDDEPIDVFDDEDKKDLLVFSQDSEIVYQWGRIGKFDMPDFDASEEVLWEVYGTIPHSTKEDRRQRAEVRARHQRAGIRIILGVLFFRRAVVPSAVALAFYLNPILGFVGLLLALGDALVGGLRVLEYLPKSKREKEEIERKRRMEHHDYHCRINPKGFAALMAENLEVDLREKTRQEALELHESQRS